MTTIEGSLAVAGGAAGSGADTEVKQVILRATGARLANITVVKDRRTNTERESMQRRTMVKFERIRFIFH